MYEVFINHHSLILSNSVAAELYSNEETTTKIYKSDNQQEAPKDDDVIDADYEEVDEDKKASGQ